MKTMQRMKTLVLSIMMIVACLGNSVLAGMAETAQPYDQDQIIEERSLELLEAWTEEEPEAVVNLYSVAGSAAPTLGNGNEDDPADPNEPGGTEDEDLHNEADGSKIEKIDIFWVTPDVPTSDGHPEHLYLNTSSNALLSMQFQIEVSFSGQYDYLPGDVTIRFPAQIWHKRDGGDLYGDMSYSVPEAPSTAADFNWTRIGDEIVLTNTKVLGATSKAMFQFTIEDIEPRQIVDMSISDVVNAECFVTTQEGNTIHLKSDDLTAQINTKEVVRSAHKYGQLYEDAPSSLPASLLANLPDGTTKDDYVYVCWTNYVYHNGNQPFTLEFEDDVTSNDYAAWRYENGERVAMITPAVMLGATSASAELIKEEDDTKKEKVTDVVLKDTYHADTTSSYDHTRVVWTAYRKDQFYVPKNGEPTITYIMKNDATWTLTEQDPDVPENPDLDKDADEQLVTTATASATVRYEPMQWVKPTGHFEVFKYTISRPYKDHLYGYALNRLDLGENLDIPFELRTVGYGYPWTISMDVPHDNERAMDEAEQDQYGYYGWTQTTDDYATYLPSMQGYEPLTTEDFQISYLRVPAPTMYSYGKFSNGSWGYKTNSSLPKPDLRVYYQISESGEWVYAGTVSWGETGKGAMTITTANGAEVGTRNGSQVIIFPDHVSDIRTQFTSNVCGGVQLEHTDLAGIEWPVYPTITVRASDNVREFVQQLFSETDTPSTKFRNDDKMTVDVYEGTEWAKTYDGFLDSSMATLAGAAYGVSPSKSVRFNRRTDNDVEHERVILHYTARVREQSNLENRTDYNDAVAANVIPAETKGIWYDLLPPGIYPDMSSIKLRGGDRITGAYTIPNYENTDRILLVVECELTPRPSTYSGRWYDEPTLTFDAIYPWENVHQYGQTGITNYVAFESLTENLRHDTLGTISGQKGEPDKPEQDPSKKNNGNTPSMPAAIAAALTDLDPNTDDNRFLYARADVNLTLNLKALTGLSKAVKDDLVGVWTQGLDDQEQVNVYEGHDYTYRLRVVSGPNTVTKDIVLYDTVENYRIPDPNDSVVHDATKAADYADVESKKNWYGDWQESDEYPGGQWRGTLKSIDLSEFVQGYHVDVKLWVSEIPNLQFADAPEDANNEVKREIFASGAYNIDDEDERALSGWVQVTPDENGVWTVPADMNVSAIAIDARLMEDGSEFELDELQAVTAYLHMTAPDDGDTQEEVDSNYHAKGAYAHVADSADTENCTIDWEAARDPKNNMHAYNNARMKAKAYVKGNPDSSSDQMIRNDYTRVGIMPRIITVKKAWNDDDDYDALRTQSVTVHLMRKQFGDADWTDMQRSAVLSADNDWQAVFQQVDIVDALNRPYQYSFVEDEVPGYTYQVTKDNDGAYLLTNTHEKDTVSISGQKVWTGDEDQTELRPASIKVSLYRDGVYQRAITVRPNAEGEWNYSFGNLLKNKRGGEPYVYTVEEEYVPKYISEYEGYEVINNTLRPFGDLTVEKIIANATEAAKDREFTFTFTAFEELTQAYIDQLRQEHEESGSAEPFTAPTTGSMLLDAYAYVITEDDTEVETGTIKSGDEFTLKGGQKIRIIDLPSEATYTIEETAAAGYTLTGTVGDTGTIRAGRTQEAEFTNTYHSAGAVQLSASKRLTGHRLNRGQFRFDLVDMTEGSDTYEQVIRMGSNEAPSSTTQDEDGVVTSLADVFFGQIRYTEADDGKTFTYVIKEQDTGKSGYTYDADQKTVTVTVADNGNGTMTVTATPSSAAELIFDNTYQAEGEISFKAWKVLEVYDLEKDQFEFELYKYDPTAGDKVGEPLQTAKNNEDGTINFTPIKFTQNDVNVDPNNPNVYWYLLREKKGNDPAVVYSNIEYVIKVTPYDNNDGTISFAQDDQQVKRIYNEVNCQTCDGVGYLTSSGAPAVYGATSDGKGQEVWLWDVHKSSNSGINASTRKAVIYVPDAALCETCHGACYSSAGVSCEACKGTGLRVGVDLDITSQNVAGCFEDSFVFDGLRTTDIYRHYDAMGFDSVDEFCMRVGRVVDGTLIESENGNDSRAFRAYIPKSDIGKRAPITGGTHACETCGGTGKVLVEGRIESTGETTGPVFVNGYRDGNLKLTKNINNGNPSQKFKFKVKLVGLGTGNFSLERKGDGDNSGAHEDGGESGGEATHDISGILPVYHADNSLINGTVAYAALKKSTGELIFFRTDANDPMDPWGNPIGASGFNSNRKESADGEYVWYNRVDNGSYPWPWTNNSTDRLKIQTVTMRDPVRPGSLTYFFQNCTNIVSLDLSKMDIPAGRSVAMWGICDGLSNLKEANFGMMNLSLTSDVQYMFRYCTSLETVNIGHLVRSGYATNRSNYQDNAFTGTKVTRITIGNGTYFSGTITGAYPKPPAGYTDLWTNVEHPEIQLKSVDLFTSPGHGGTWELDPKYYNITFDANGGSGSMQNQRVNTHRDFTTGYSFYRFGYDFTGFEDNYGHFYAVDENGKIKIPSNTYSNASNTEDVQITLTAQWDPVDNTAVMENDTLTITMYGGESVTIFNIPAGTAYEIWEEVPDGWILVSKVNDSGVIVPLETAQSVFTDEYAPDKATSSMTASKLMDGKLTGGYTIGLYKVNNDNTETLIDTKVSSAGGIASFDIITYTLADVGTHEYVIREIVENPDPTIQYDTHDERVRVVVYDDGRGNLYATTGYLDGNAVFVNSTKPGNLELSKTLEKASPKAAEQTFTYTISFLNAQEQPIKLQKVADDGKSMEDILVLQAERSNGSTVTPETVPVSAEGKAVVTIKGGETLTLKDIPDGVHYKVEETISVGWTQTGATGTSGEIESTKTAKAGFTNTYAATGRVYLEVTKALTGGTPQENEFTFELYKEEDWNEEANAPKEDAQPLLTAQNAAIDTNETIADPNSDVMGATLPNPNHGKSVAHFDAITYTQDNVGKTFTYYVREVPGDDPQIVYTAEVKTIAVTVTDETGEGRLTATPDYEAGAQPVFYNAYQPGSLKLSKILSVLTDATRKQLFPFTITLNDAQGNPISGEYDLYRTLGEAPQAVTMREYTDRADGVTIHGVARLIGRAFTENDQITLKLVPQSVEPELDDGENETINDIPMPAEDTLILDANGLDTWQYAFGTIYFQQENAGRTYHYEVRVTVDSLVQANGALSYIFPVDITVTEQDDGVAAACTRRDLPEMVWEYPAQTRLRFDENGKAKVLLAHGEQAVIDGLPNGAVYQIVETVPDGYTQTGKSGDTGTIIAAQTQEAEFTNTYDATGELQISLKKLFYRGITDEAIALKENQFSFTLHNGEGRAIQQKMNLADGTVTFDPIEFTLDDIGEMRFSITEDKSSASGVRTDDSTLHAYVTISDTGSGTLSVETKYTRTRPSAGEGEAEEQELSQEELSFINREVKNGKLGVQVQKTLVGRKLENRFFKFELLDQDGKVLGVAYNNASGIATFSPEVIEELNFDSLDLAGETSKTYTFKVREVNDGRPGYTYAGGEAAFDVTVTDDGTSVLKVNGKENPIIRTRLENVYSAAGEIVLSAQKEFYGKRLEAGQFTFELVEEDRVIQTATNDDGGKVTFTISYGQQDVDETTHTGEKEYVIRERIPQVVGDGLTYDTHEERIVVSLTDDGKGNITAVSDREEETLQFNNFYDDQNEPGFEKKVDDQNDSSEAEDDAVWQDSADYDIGDDVPYRLQATLIPTMSNFRKYHIVFVDRMEAGLTNNRDYQVFVGTQEVTDYTVLSEDDHSFQLRLDWAAEDDGYLDESLNGAQVSVFFTARLNEDAKIGETGNVNEASLKYSHISHTDDTPIQPQEEEKETPKDAVIVFTYRITVDKEDQQGASLSGAEFKLEKFSAAENAWTDVSERLDLAESSDTTFRFKGLDDGVYRLTEITTPFGYIPVAPITFDVTAEHETEWNGDLDTRADTLTSLNGEADAAEEGVITLLAEKKDGEVLGKLVNAPVTVTVEGSKRWEDENDQDGKRPESITVNLLADGEKIDSASVKAEDGWKWRFEDLPKYSGGKEIEYSITEEPVEGYTATVQGYDVINSHDIETIDIHVTKEWKDGNDKDAIRPRSIVIHLLADGKETASATLVPDKKGVWEHTFTGLPKYRDHGTEIAYTVTEEAVKGYTSKLVGTAQEGLTIMNEHIPVPTPTPRPTTTPEPYYFKFSFTKLWQGDHEDSIDWVMYHPDGTVAHKKFNKKVVSESEWHYEAWFASSEDYYIIENVPEGYKVRYENVGAHAGETDRCYNGGTIINYKVPKTGDPADLKLWLSYVLLGLGAVCSVWAYSKRKQTKI